MSSKETLYKIRKYRAFVAFHYHSKIVKVLVNSQYNSTTEKLIEVLELCKFVALTSNIGFINKLKNKFSNLRKLNIESCDLDLQYEIILPFLSYDDNSHILKYLNILENDDYETALEIYSNTIDMSIYN